MQRKIASLSGSTAASDVSERRKLEAQLREAQEELNDSYYSHAVDAQSAALDEESEAYQKTRNDLVKDLREKLENVDEIIEDTLNQILSNADITLEELNDISSEYGVNISSNLVNPWKEASEAALEFKDSLDDSLSKMINGDGIITVFGTKTTRAFSDINTALYNTGIKTQEFSDLVQTELVNIENAIGSENTAFTQRISEALQYPWEQMSGDDSPINTFSDKVYEALDGAIDYAESNYEEMKNSLEAPWNDANLDTFSNEVESTLRKAVSQAESAAKQISQSMASIENSVNTTPTTSTTTTTTTNNSGSTYDGTAIGTNPREVIKLQTLLLRLGRNVTVNGKYDQDTIKAVRFIQNWAGLTIDGKYGQKTHQALNRYIDYKIPEEKDNNTNKALHAQWSLITPMYAKGTIGTKKDSFAITDESWIGDEITLGAGKTGHLQYLKKGSAVLPADISENLMEWGKLNPNDQNASSNVSLISNNVSESQNEFNFNTDGLSQSDIPKFSEKGIEAIKNLQEFIEDTDELLKNVIGNNNISIEDAYSLIKETLNNTVKSSTTALKAINDLTDTYKTSLNLNLTSPWISALHESQYFEDAAELYYDDLVQHIDDYKGNLEAALSIPYEDLTGDKEGNQVYDFLEYAKQTSVDSIIDYADENSSIVNASLSSGFNNAQDSVTEFSDVGITAIDDLSDRFTNRSSGLIKALNDTTTAAIQTKAAIESIPSYSSSSSVGGSNLTALGGAVAPSFTNVSSQYGYRTDPITGERKFHSGTDFAAPGGSAINAYAGGTVSLARWNGNYGNCVIIDHGNGHQTLYGHASSLNVSEGQSVKKGQRIASVGSTGRSTGNHLHFEYRLNGKSSSPSNLPAFAKGTLGVKKDQFAITDEYGPELTLHAGPEGRLQFLTAGTSVIPKEATQKLLAMVESNPVDVLSDSIVKPMVNNVATNNQNVAISIDSFIKADNITNDTLPELNKMIDKKIDEFNKKLNYALRRA